MAFNIRQEDLKYALPSLTGTTPLDGLEHPADIHRDAYGIPHMRTGSLHDAFFVQGFVHAQDRLWQMDLDRRRAYGRWAELAGQAALPMDIFARRTRLEAGSRIDYDAFSDETRSMLEAYAEGVNAFIGATETLPVEYRIIDETPGKWQPWDSCAVFKIRHILMGTWRTKLLRARLVDTLGPEITARLRAEGPTVEVLVLPSEKAYAAAMEEVLDLAPGIEAVGWLPELEGGSNNWAVHGSRTASGKPLVAGDPHRPLDVPNVYYQNHVGCPEFDVIGLSFPGVPGFPHFGHNGNVAWCVTHAMADYQDLYVEQFHPDDPTRYRYKDGWREADRHQEVVQVRDAEPVEVDITVTHHGPVVIGDPGKGAAVTMRYTATAEPNATFEALLPMLRAESVEALDAAMKTWVDPCNNLTMADVHGTIGYLTRGKVPIRSRVNGWLPVPGWTGEHEWKGMIPFEEMPRSRNPERGFLVTANNRIVGNDYPHYLTLNYVPPFRAERIEDCLGSLNSSTADDMAAIHGDRLSIPSRLFVNLIKGLQVEDEPLVEAVKRLDQWDGRMDLDSTGATIYTVTRDELSRRVISQSKLKPFKDNPFRDEPVVPGVRLEDWTIWSVIPPLLDSNDTGLLDEGQGWSQLLAQALVRAVAWLTDTLGPDMDEWKWGSLHRTNPIHPLASVYKELGALLNPPSVSLGGDGDTAQAAGTFPGVSYAVSLTSVARYLFDLGDWDNSRWIVPLGSSGHPGSPHYADQAELWSDVKLIPMTYVWEKIIAGAETRQRLEPHSQ